MGYDYHQDYEDHCQTWTQCRDAVAGEEAVKSKGERYLPKFEGMDPAEYDMYKRRTKFLPASGRTLKGLHGMLFRREPEVKLGKEDFATNLAADADLSGCSLQEYTKDLSLDLLKVGRAGTLVEWSDTEARSYLSFYVAEAIVNWSTVRVAGEMVLGLVVLKECVPDEAGRLPFNPDDDGVPASIEQLRVLQLLDGVYVVQIWRSEGSDGGSSGDQKVKKMVMIEEKVPLRKGAPMDFIPFVFHSAENTDDECCKPPLEDIVSVNLHHYRLQADYDNALHFTASPTPWVSGFPVAAGQKLRIGSNYAWHTETVGATAGFLEYSGSGLSTIKAALDDDKAEMAMLGARLLEEQKRDSEAAETVRLRQTGETSVLANLSDNVSKTMGRALKIAVWWHGFAETPAAIDNETASIQVNRDFIESKMASADLAAIVTAWIQGAVSHNTVLYNLRKGEVIPPGVSDEDEQALIAEQAPMVSAVMQATAAASGGGNQGGGAGAA